MSYSTFCFKIMLSITAPWLTTSIFFLLIRSRCSFNAHQAVCRLSVRAHLLVSDCSNVNVSFLSPCLSYRFALLTSSMSTGENISFPTSYVSKLDALLQEADIQQVVEILINFLFCMKKVAHVKMTAISRTDRNVNNNNF